MRQIIRPAVQHPDYFNILRMDFVKHNLFMDDDKTIVRFDIEFFRQLHTRFRIVL